MEENNEVSMFKSTLNYGVMLGLAMIIFYILIWMFDLFFESYMAYINYVILLAGIVLSTKGFRDSIPGGIMSYGKALGTGVLVSLFSAVLLSVFMYVLYKLIDPGLIERTIDESIKTLYEQGRTDEQIQAVQQVQERFVTPFTIAAGMLFQIIFIGFIMSLIASIFLKNNERSV